MGLMYQSFVIFDYIILNVWNKQMNQIKSNDCLVNLLDSPSVYKRFMEDK